MRCLASRIVTSGLAILVLGVFLAAPASAQVGSADWERAISNWAESVTDQVSADAVGGIAAGVVVDGDLVWARGFGLADRASRATMEPSAISRTGSISKSVTAVLMMRLVDQGVVELDVPVERYLPEFGQLTDRRPGAEAVTLRHLASHTAGIVREPRNLPAAVSGPLEAWEERILSALPETAYDSVPGARYQYSNIGFGTLGLALSRAAGRPFIEMVREEIFTPLGMTGSSFVVDGTELEARLASGYTNGRDGTIDGSMPAREHSGRGYKVPNGGVYSTVADLGRFLGAVAGVPGLRILSEESRLEMISVQTPENPDQGYGLGFSVQRTEGGSRIVGHGGSVAGYTAYMAVDIETGVGVVLLRNYNQGETNLARAAQSLIQELAPVLR